MVKGPIDIQIEGVQEAIKDLAATEVRKRGQLVTATQETLLHGQKDMRQMLSQKGSGIIYYRGGVSHQASAPGEPPATDTGVYRASWHVRRELSGLGGDLYTQQDRARALEYGDPSRNLKPRPHAGPVAALMADDYKKRSRRELRE